jgi:hypothetical protein
MPGHLSSRPLLAFARLHRLGAWLKASDRVFSRTVDTWTLLDGCLGELPIEASFENLSN